MKKADKSFNGMLIIAILAFVSALLFWSVKKERDRRLGGSETVAQTEQATDATAGKSETDGTSESKQDGKANKAMSGKVSDKLKVKPRIMRKRLEPEATRRLATSPQRIRTVLTTTGRGENADWGVKGMASFVLTYSADCTAEILKKSENAVGEIEVVEKRTFTSYAEELELSDTDVALALYDTLPLGKAFAAVNAIGEALEWTGEPDAVVVGTTMKEVGNMVDVGLRMVDGKSVRGILGMVGMEIPDSVEKNVSNFIQNRLKSLFRPNELQGKSYLITYHQDKESGAPLRVDFTYADGSPIQSEKEWLILRRANAFIDLNLVPNKNCSPGDCWVVDCSEFDCLLDPYVDGAYSGNVGVERKDDDKSGNWVLGVRPSDVSIISDKGKTTGELHIDGGEAQIDGNNAYVKAVVVTGKGKMKNLTNHHMLFKTRFEGACSFRGCMVTEPISK